MSYRNDHDAALARVDALASENSQLAAENAQLRAGMTIAVPQAERSVHRGVAALVLATLAGAGILAATVISHTHHRNAAPATREHSVAIDKAELRACVRTLETSPPNKSARETDPRSQRASIGPVLMSTGCRPEIAKVLDGAILSTDERATLQRWRNSEASLDAVVSMIGEYYAHDPYVLDGYSTAPQLWREYDTALTHRNIALAEWLDASREVEP